MILNHCDADARGMQGQDDNWLEQKLAAMYQILVQHAFIVCCSIVCATCKLTVIYTLQHATNVCVCMHLAPLIHAHATKQLIITNLKCAAMSDCICCVHTCASYMCFSMCLEVSHTQVVQNCVTKQSFLFQQCDMICMH